jgi:hypothetical protein
MDNGSLMLIPVGGLANRMRAIASAYTLTRQVSGRLQVVWFQDWALNAPFHSVFIKPEQPMLREATLKDRLFYDRARRRNLWLPALAQRLLFERRIMEQEIGGLLNRQFDFAQWMQGHRCYMSSYSLIVPVQDSLYRQLFVPVMEVTSAVSRYQEQFSAHTVGLHIRRTDHVMSIADSPDELFVKRVETEIEAHADTKVFLATDSESVKQLFRQRFGNRIITQQAAARRDSIEGIRGGLIDMYTLARTDRLYGSTGSSFAEIAACLGGKPLEVLSLQEQSDM